jgi:hypothetical protein
MCANAGIESRGIPFDTDTHTPVTESWDEVCKQLIAAIDADFGVYEDGEFRRHLFAAYLRRFGISWPLTETGQLDLQEKTFRDMAKVDARLAPLHELRTTLSKLREIKIKLDADGRSRTPLWAFGSKTGRTQPSASAYVFGPATWVRFFIQARPGQAIAYLDFEQQEFGIAAILSGDQKMQEAYLSGDPYLAFAQQAGAITEASDSEHIATMRPLYKQTSLGVIYGMGERSLAMRIGQPRLSARALRRAHRHTYQRYWQWLEQVLLQAAASGYIYTKFGWPLYVGKKVPVRTLKNFLMQGTAAIFYGYPASWPPSTTSTSSPQFMMRC